MGLAIFRNSWIVCHAYSLQRIVRLLLVCLLDKPVKFVGFAN